MADSPPQARSRPNRRRLAYAGLAAFAVAAAIGYRVWPDPAAAPIASSPAVAEFRAENDLIASAAANPGYLGSKACAACHAAKFETFKETRHHWAATAPDDRPMPAAFHSGGASFASSDPAVRFAMAHENGRYVQKVSVTTPKIRREATAPIGMVYGHGGKFDEVYFKWDDNRLTELPVTWLHPTKEWANAPVNPHAPGDLSRVTTTRCVECHTTWVAHEPGTANGY